MSFPRYPKYKDSGVEWLGQVPEHWTPIRYKNVFQEKEFTSGCTLPSGAISFGRVVFKNDEALNEATKATYQEVLSGEFVINPINLNYDLKSLRTAFSQINTCVSPAYVVLKPKIILAGNYFKYQLHMFDLRHMKTLGAGVRQTITFADIGSCFTQMPPLDEQNRIAAFLEQETAKIDALVAEQERLMALLKEKRQAVISHAVTKGLNPKAALKPSGIEWLGEVPAHWRTSRLKYATSKIVDCPHETPTLTDDGDYLTIRTSDIDQGAIFPNQMRAVDEVEYLKRIRREPLLRDDIVYSREGGRWGHAALVPDNERFCLGQRMMQFRASNQFVAAYIMWHLNAKNAYVQGDVDTVGAASPHVNVDTISNYRIAAPPFEEQAIIAARLDTELAKFDMLTAEAQHAIDLLQERRTAMISAAVTGQIDVREFSFQQRAAQQT